MNPAAAYENAHITSLEAQLSRAVDSCMRLRPADPVGYIGVRLISASAVAEPPTATHPATEAVASEPSAGAVTAEWKAVGWLDSEETNKELAAAMLGKSFITGGDELAAMRALGGSATLEDELTMRLAAAIGPLVARLAPRLRALATVEASTSGEMQAKFSQECRGMLEYGSLSVFFGGLEGLVGSPNPKVMAAMTEEHSAGRLNTRLHDEQLRPAHGLCGRVGLRGDARQAARRWVAGGEEDPRGARRRRGRRPRGHPCIGCAARAWHTYLPRLLTSRHLPRTTYHVPHLPRTTFSPYLPPTTAYSFSPWFVMVRCRAAPAAADS